MGFNIFVNRDISFLFDVPKEEKKLERPDRIDRSSPRKEASEKPRKVNNL